MKHEFKNGVLSTTTPFGKLETKKTPRGSISVVYEGNALKYVNDEPYKGQKIDEEGQKAHHKESLREFLEQQTAKQA